ncbi:S41 family peptidase [bacterium]|nr:S41 family peptidase [bacterium]
MFNTDMNKKWFWIFLITTMLLFVANKVLMDYKNPLISSDEELVNHEYVSSQKLYENVWNIVRKNYYEADMNGQDWYRWKHRYDGKIKNDDDAKIAIDTMLASLNDPYSRYMSKEEYNEQNTSISSKICGIGVNIASIAGKTEIINVIEGTPAQNANLQSGDIITEIDGKDANGLSISEVANLVRGPENTLVQITVLRNSDKFVKKIIRKEIKIKTVKSSVEDNIGYIQINSFIGSTTPNEFLEAAEKTKDTDGLVIDLRGNTGGLLPNAIFIANLFIPNGKLVSIVGRGGNSYDIQAQHTDFEINKPVVILVDGGSASASEIFSGAMKDYNRAKLVGTKTFGKGMVQKIFPVENETGLNLTIAKYLTPAGTDINKKGIKPDYEVQFTEKNIRNKEDVQLNEAKKILTKMINQLAHN